MAYGAECIDSEGRTIFNSNNPCELVLWEGTAKTFDQAGGFVSGQAGRVIIPDYCFGHDLGTEGSTANFNMKRHIPANASIPAGQETWGITIESHAYLSSDSKEIYSLANIAVPSYSVLGSATYPFTPPRAGYLVYGEVGFDEFVTNYTSNASEFIDAKVNWQWKTNAYQKEAWIDSFKVHNVRRASNGLFPSNSHDEAYIVWKVRSSVSVGYPTTAGADSAAGTSYQNIQRGNYYSNTFGVRFTRFEKVTIVPEIWIRPQSSGTHSFSLLRPTIRHDPQKYLDPRKTITGTIYASEGLDVEANEVRFYQTTYWLYTNDRGASTNWDIKVTAPADVWGKTWTGRNKKYADSSNKTHGLECYDAGLTGWGSQASVQKTTYSSLARVAKESGAARGKASLPRSGQGSWQANHNYTASGRFTLHDGTAAQHPHKYYCRMNSTMILSRGNGTHYINTHWTWQYKWYGNNHILSEWRYVPLLNPTTNSLTTNGAFGVADQFYGSPQVYAVATFGEPT